MTLLNKVLATLVASLFSLLILLAPQSVSANAIVTTVSTAANPVALALSPDQTEIWVVSYDDSLMQIFDATSLALIANINLGSGSPQGLTFSPDGATVYVAYSADMFGIVDTNSRQLTTVSMPTTGSSVQNPTVSPDGTHLFLPDSYSGDILVYDTANNQLLTTIHSPVDPDFVTFSPDGATFIVSGRDLSSVLPSGVAFYDANTLLPLSGDSNLSGWDAENAVFSPDGLTAFVSEFGTSLKSIDTSHRTVTSTVLFEECNGDCFRPAITPNGAQLWLQNTFTGGFNIYSPQNLLQIDAIAPSVSAFGGQSGTVINQAGTRVFSTYSQSNIFTVAEIDPAQGIPVPQELPNTGVKGELSYIAVMTLLAGIGLLATRKIRKTKAKP